MASARCNRCGDIKELSEDNYQPDRQCTSGFRGVCKSCVAVRKRQWEAKRKQNRASLQNIQSGETTLTSRRDPLYRYRCHVGDVVMHRGGMIYVTEVLAEGAGCQKCYISGCKLDPSTAKPLTRSGVYPGQDWQHVKKQIGA